MDQLGKTKHRGGAISRRPYGIELPHLRAWRYYRTMSQRELADAAHTTAPTISQIELGKTTSFSTVRKLAEGLQITVDNLRYELPPHEQPATVTRPTQ